MATHEASCSCGQLRVELEGEPVRISACHCLACQRRTGSVVAVQARWPLEAARITGESLEYLRVADDGDGERRFHFCPACGATVYYFTDAKLIAIPVGALADPQFPPPRVSVYESRKHSWVTMPADAQHYE